MNDPKSRAGWEGKRKLYVQDIYEHEKWTRARLLITHVIQSLPLPDPPTLIMTPTQATPPRLPSPPRRTLAKPKGILKNAPGSNNQQ